MLVLLQKTPKKNRNSLINDRKLKNQRLKTNRPSGFTSQECVKKNSAHQKDYWSHTHQNLFSNVFDFSVSKNSHSTPWWKERQYLEGWCLKTYRPSRLSYQECVQFFSGHREVCWSHTHQILFSNASFWHLQGAFFNWPFYRLHQA